LKAQYHFIGVNRHILFPQKEGLNLFFSGNKKNISLTKGCFKRKTQSALPFEIIVSQKSHFNNSFNDILKYNSKTNKKQFFFKLHPKGSIYRILQNFANNARLYGGKCTFSLTFRRVIGIFFAN